MLLQTKVELPARLPLVDRTQSILLMGSCFAENMGRRMADAKFRIDINPYGILYNPLSIAGVGLQLSFASMVGLLVLSPRIRPTCSATRGCGTAPCTTATSPRPAPRRHWSTSTAASRRHIVHFPVLSG